MKLVRLLCTAFAVTLITGWSTWSYACDKDKASAAAAAHASGVCTAEMAATCTPEMAAACKAKMSAASAARRAGTKVDAVAASASGTCGAKAMKVSAVTASASGACDSKAMKASAASMAANSACCASKASAATAKNTARPTAAKVAVVAAASGAGSAKIVAAGAGGQCSSHGLGAMAADGSHDDCEACVDMSSCSEALDAVGAHRQTVRLKNGVMYVYTADSQRNVSAVQAAVARRGAHMAQLVSAGAKARLCPECKIMRGAMASGKLSREIVNIEGGSLTLITSTDRAVVAKIHAMADEKVAARTKS